LIGGRYPLPRVFREDHRSYRRIRGVRFEPIYKPIDYNPENEDRPDSNRYNDPLEYKAVVTPSKREGLSMGIHTELCGVCPTLVSAEFRVPMKSYPDRQDPYVAYRQFGSRFYQAQRVRLDAMAMHFGLPDGIPKEWRRRPIEHPEWQDIDTDVYWHQVLYQGIGAAVPIYMVFAFAQAALYATLDKSQHKYLQLDNDYVPRDKPFPKEWVDTMDKQALQYE
jgi:hypothetical protein